MADLSDLQASLSIKLAGATPTGGIETFWAQVDPAGSLQVAGEGVAGTPAGGVVSVQGVAGGTALPTSFLDIAPANGTITAVDTVTSSLVGANGQVFYFGTPTTNSAAVFAVSSIDNVSIQANILGGGGTLVVELSMDGGSFWFRPNAYQVSTQVYSNGFTSPFMVTLNVAAMTQVRVRAITSWAGTATIIVRETVNHRMVTVGDALPQGANIIGALVANQSVNFNQFGGSAVTLGQKVMASSIPVAFASDQSSIFVKNQDGSGNNINSNNNQLQVRDVINTAGQNRAQSVTTTAAEALGGATILANRKFLSMTPTAGTIYWGFTSGVTVATGTPIFKNQTMTLAVTDNVHIFVIAASTIDSRMAEGS